MWPWPAPQEVERGEAREAETEELERSRGFLETSVFEERDLPPSGTKMLLLVFEERDPGHQQRHFVSRLLGTGGH